jgi:hypothetical protein
VTVSILVLMAAPKDDPKSRADRIRADAQRALQACVQELVRQYGTQAAVAAKMGIDQPTISGILDHQKIRMPRADRLAVMSSFLGRSSDDMLGLRAQTGNEASLLTLIGNDALARRLYAMLHERYGTEASVDLQAAKTATAPTIPPLPQLPPAPEAPPDPTKLNETMGPPYRRPTSATKQKRKRRKID